MVWSKKATRSLYVTLGIIIVSTVALTMSIQAMYTFSQTKEKLLKQMIEDGDRAVVSLQKNIIPLIESYSINEYNKLIHNEMLRDNVFAIIVEDYNMGTILGEPAFISGKLKNNQSNIISYDPKKSEQVKQLQDCFYSKTFDLISKNKEKLGTISVYISDHAMQEQLHAIISQTLINAAVISLFLVLLLFLSIHIFLLRALSHIVMIISQTDEDGIPLKNIPKHPAKEINVLSDSMNRMISSIRNSRIALKEQHYQLVEQKNILHHQAYHDALTNLPNRLLFNKKLEHAINKASSNDSKVALFFIDLDHFKEINDALGHAFGDKILQSVTQKLKKTLHKKENLARLGGDEFTIIIDNLTHEDEAAIYAQKILEALAKPIVIDDNELYVSSSIGISIYPNDGDNAQDLFKYADAAMYRAKDEGRSNFQYYSADMTERAQERILMETHLRGALKNEELIVYYQPQVDGLTDTLIGLEALVRWQHPTMGLISPAKFIPLAETTGLIVKLDYYVMHKTMLQLVSWHKEALMPGRVAINISAKQLHQKDFFTQFNELLESTGCNPEWIELEVTESQIMKNPKRAIDILDQLKALGIQIAVDDFGTGYSSLSYLKRLPIHKLKIDQSFVKDLPHDEEDAAITKAVIALAQSLNLRLIAEGVETLEQKDFLIKNGCHKIQGYYYAKPMPAEKVEKLLRHPQFEITAS